MSKKPGRARAPAKQRSNGNRRQARAAAAAPLRYAHPFFTSTPVHLRPVSSATGTRCMAEFAAEELGPTPAPSRPATMNLQDIIGQPGVEEIQSVGAIRFHAVGDTGRPTGVDSQQEDVAHAMTSDFDPSAGGRNPALLLHLGDVVYGHDKEKLYRDEFYRPYMKYPGKIVAIPGNHDGETFAGTDPVSLKAFRDNFCAPRAAPPPIAKDVRIYRETMTQPGVYWLLACPFLNIIGLYSNIAEGPGNLLGASGDGKQIKWLTSTLSSLKPDKRALVIATHHPPYSSAGHGPSVEMLKQIDTACADAGAAPHAMLAGHSHNYQRYTRTTRFGGGGNVEIPYIVVGCGGHSDSSVVPAHGQQMGETIFEKSRKGYGYLVLTANATELTIEMFAVAGGVKSRFDTTTVNLASRRVS